MKALAVVVKTASCVLLLAVAVIGCFIWYYRDIPQDILLENYGEESARAEQ